MSATIKKKTHGKRVTPSQVIRLVRPIVEANQPKGFRIVIKGSRYSQIWKAWVVFLDTDREGASALHFVRSITDIHELAEEEARKQGFRIFVTSAGNPEV